MKQQLKTLFFVLFCLLVSISNTLAAERVPLWGASFYGMTLNEVLASVPHAQSTPSNDTPPPADHNLQALAMLDSIEISGEAFKAWFMFNNGKLNEVILTLVPKLNDTTGAYSEYIKALYTHYVMLLTAKYGEPISQSWQDFAPSNMHFWNTQWVVNSTNIDLTVEKTQLEISYGAQYAEALKKL